MGKWIVGFVYGSFIYAGIHSVGDPREVGVFTAQEVANCLFWLGLLLGLCYLAGRLDEYSGRNG